MSADEVVFMDPPAREYGSGTRGAMANRLAPLRERPGEWARIRTDMNPGAAGSYARLLRDGKGVGIEAGEFEALSRKNEQGGYDVFARYIGGQP